MEREKKRERGHSVQWKHDKWVYDPCGTVPEYESTLKRKFNFMVFMIAV